MATAVNEGIAEPMKEKKMWVLPCLVLCMGIIAGVRAVADPPGPEAVGIIPPDARLEHLFTRSAKLKGGLTEGPAVAPAQRPRRAAASTGPT